MSDIFLHDARLDCMTGIGILSIKEYLDLIEPAYAIEGGIDGQRAALKTKTGIAIRRRMVDDIGKGAILPPIVIGVVAEDGFEDDIRSINKSDELVDYLKKIKADSISIIDGMQRTTAIREANLEGKIDNNRIRIELWLAKNVKSLLYRMLVLNTGQIPWDIRRQLETVYRQVLNLVRKEIDDIEIIELGDDQRRSGAGQYRASRIIELFLAFTMRTPHIELKEQVAADFARMDTTEVMSNDHSMDHFIRSIKQLVTMDRIFGAFELHQELSEDNIRFKKGRDIFTSAPGSIGFIAAVAQYVYGKPGYDINFSKVKDKYSDIEASISKFKLNAIDLPKGSDPIDFLTLNERISRRSGRIGEFEREFFLRAFLELFSSGGDILSLKPCWAAY